jgi:hypothetical protein
MGNRVCGFFGVVGVSFDPSASSGQAQLRMTKHWDNPYVFSPLYSFEKSSLHLWAFNNNIFNTKPHNRLTLIRRGEEVHREWLELNNLLFGMQRFSLILRRVEERDVKNHQELAIR